MSELISSASSVWEECLQAIKLRITYQAFKTWFEPTRALSLENGTLTIQVPSPFFYEWIEEHYYALVRKSIIDVIGNNAKLVYMPLEDQKPEEPESRAITLAFQPPVSQRQIPNGGGSAVVSTAFPLSDQQKPHQQIKSFLNERYTFENFVTGEGNQLAYAAGKAVADNPGGTRFNPLVVYGGTGLGKTHLVQAIGHEILRQQPQSSVLYISSERFTLEFVEAISKHRTQEFANYYRSVDTLIVDDIQFFVGKEKTQDNFFHTFNALHQHGKQIILTSDVPPKQLRGLDDRLISRFQWGLTADIQPPDLETRLAILQKISTYEDIELPPDVIDYIARNVTNSVREIEGCVISLLAECSMRNLSPTIELARHVVNSIASIDNPEITVEHVQHVVSQHLNVPHNILVGKTRKQEAVYARQLAMYLLRNLTGLSLKTIGSHFGGRDHTTVMYAIDSIKSLKATDENTRRTLTAVRRTLNVPEEN